MKSYLFIILPIGLCHESKDWFINLFFIFYHHHWCILKFFWCLWFTEEIFPYCKCLLNHFINNNSSVESIRDLILLLFPVSTSFDIVFVFNFMLRTILDKKTRFSTLVTKVIYTKVFARVYSSWKSFIFFSKSSEILW